MKRKIAIVLAGCICAQFLTGCEKTPDDVIVTEKNKNNVSNYESMEDTGNPIEELIGAPKHYTNTISLQNGALIIDTDAEVKVPKASSVNTVKVTAKEFDQEMVDKITKVFFGDSPVYEGAQYYKWTKSELEENIAILKNFIAQGNLDPYGYGTDQDGNLSYDIYGVINSYEKMLEDASESREKKQVKPQFGLTTEYEENGVMKEEVSEDSFMGVAETEEGNFDFQIQKDDDFMTLFSAKINKIREGLDINIEKEWIDADYILGAQDNIGSNGETYNFAITEKELSEIAGLSYEDAKAIADEKVKALGFDDMEINDWSYSLFCVGQQTTKENIQDGGYHFFYTRSINEFPITYTMENGGAVESMESTTVPWGYEVCNILVGDDGIQQAEIYNVYDVGEVQNENVKLMNFDEIIKIYEQMMEISNADISEYETNRTYHIKEIKLGYSRIYDPKTDNRSGILVPVWDFFGGFDSDMTDGSISRNNGEHSKQSFMTINAIDGTVVDRELGY